MKKIFATTIILAITIFAVNAQRGGGLTTWFSIAGKAGYGSTMMLNLETISDENHVTYKYHSPSFFAGGRFGLTFGNYSGISSNVLYTQFQQGYNINTGSQEYEKTTKFSSLDFDVTLRLTSLTGFYFEVGPQFTKLNSVEQTTSISLPTDFEAAQKNAIDNYKPMWTKALLGMGFMPYKDDRIELSIGFRATYGFSSVITDNNQYFVVNDGVFAPNYTDPTTNPINLYGVLEFNYLFGYVQRATCGKITTKFFQ